MLPAAFPGLDCCCLLMWKMHVQRQVWKEQGTGCGSRSQTCQDGGKHVGLGVAGGPWSPSDPDISTCLLGILRHVPPGHQPAACKASWCWRGSWQWGTAARGCLFRAQSTASTSAVVCIMASLPGAQLWLLSYRWFRLQKGNVFCCCVQRWFNLNCCNRL